MLRKHTVHNEARATKAKGASPRRLVKLALISLSGLFILLGAPSAQAAAVNDVVTSNAYGYCVKGSSSLYGRGGFGSGTANSEAKVYYGDCSTIRTVPSGNVRTRIVVYKWNPNIQD